MPGLIHPPNRPMVSLVSIARIGWCRGISRHRKPPTGLGHVCIQNNRRDHR